MATIPEIVAYYILSLVLSLLLTVMASVYAGLKLDFDLAQIVILVFAACVITYSVFTFIAKRIEG